MQQADMGIDASHDFAVEFENEPQNAVRRRMLRTEIQDEVADLRCCQSIPPLLGPQTLAISKRKSRAASSCGSSVMAQCARIEREA
jgi:hypothetical protein